MKIYSSVESLNVLLFNGVMYASDNEIATGCLMGREYLQATGVGSGGQCSDRS